MKQNRNRKKENLFLLLYWGFWFVFLQLDSPEGFYYKTNKENLINFLFREFVGVSQPLRDSEYFVGDLLIHVRPYFFLCRILKIPIFPKPSAKTKITRSKDYQKGNDLKDQESITDNNLDNQKKKFFNYTSNYFNSLWQGYDLNRNFDEDDSDVQKSNQ